MLYMYIKKLLRQQIFSEVKKLVAVLISTMLMIKKQRKKELESLF